MSFLSGICHQVETHPTTLLSVGVREAQSQVALQSHGGTKKMLTNKQINLYGVCVSYLSSVCPLLA